MGMEEERKIIKKRTGITNTYWGGGREKENISPEKKRGSTIELPKDIFYKFEVTDIEGWYGRRRKDNIRSWVCRLPKQNCVAKVFKHGNLKFSI